MLEADLHKGEVSGWPHPEVPLSYRYILSVLSILCMNKTLLSSVRREFHPMGFSWPGNRWKRNCKRCIYLDDSEKKGITVVTLLLSLVWYLCLLHYRLPWKIFSIWSCRLLGRWIHCFLILYNLIYSRCSRSASWRNELKLRWGIATLPSFIYLLSHLLICSLVWALICSPRIYWVFASSGPEGLRWIWIAPFLVERQLQEYPLQCCWPACQCREADNTEPSEEVSRRLLTPADWGKELRVPSSSTVNAITVRSV